MKADINREIKRNLVINCPKNVIDDYRILCFDTYKNLNILAMFNYSNFFKVVLAKLKSKYLAEFSELHTPSVSELNFYSKRKQVNPLTNSYNKKEELNTLTIRLSEGEIQDFYLVLHNVYINCFQEKYTTFSASIFFQLILDDIKSFHYDISELL